MKPIIYIFSTIFLFVGCTKYEKNYYDNGQLYSIAKVNRIFSSSIEVVFTPNGDTLEINNYKHGKLNGQIFVFSYDSVYPSKKLYNYKDGILDGVAAEYLNGRKRFEWNYNKGNKEGIFKAFYPNGNLKWDGYFFNNRLCYVNEIGNNGEVKNTHNNFDFGAEGLWADTVQVNIWLDFKMLNKLLMNNEILYSLFKITQEDTLKITDTLFKKQVIKNALIEIPLTNVDSGKYYVKVAIPTLIEYKEKHMMYDLPFIIRKDSSISVIKTKKQEDSIKLVW